LIAEHGSTLATHGNHDVRMAMLFQAGVAAWGNLEIAHMKMRLFRPFADKDLANNILPLPPFVLALLIHLAFDV
jgi:hypothetical protein